MIKVRIREAAKKRGIENAYQFGQRAGFSDRVAVRIWNNDQPPKLKTLDKICNAFQCQLGELIEHRLDKLPRNGRSSAAPQKRAGAVKGGEKTTASLSRPKRSR